MKNRFSRIIALVLCFTVLFSGSVFTASAASGAEAVLENAGEAIEKGFYNALNVVVEVLVKAIIIWCRFRLLIIHGIREMDYLAGEKKFY